jgi:HlyD family secretion protein
MIIKWFKQKNNWKLPIIGALGLLLALYTVLSRNSVSNKEPIVSPPVSPYVNNVAGIGVVEPKSEVINVATELSGVVREVLVKVGDTVKMGHPLFILDQREVNAQIKILKAALEGAKVQAKDADAQFSLVKSVLDNRSVSRDDYNRRKYNVELMSAKVDEAQAQLDQAETTKERLIVRAPIDGQILNLNARLGEFAQAGFLNEPLIRMGDMTTRYVRVEIDEENAIKITPNSVAKGFKRGDPSNPIHLTFVRFEPYVRSKQNLAVAGQHVDTHVLQIIYALEDTKVPPYVGEQMDVYIKVEAEKKNEG